MQVAGSLNSGDCFALCTENQVFVWCGEVRIQLIRADRFSRFEVLLAGDGNWAV